MLCVYVCYVLKRNMFNHNAVLLIYQPKNYFSSKLSFATTLLCKLVVSLQNANCKTTDMINQQCRKLALFQTYLITLLLV